MTVISLLEYSNGLFIAVVALFSLFVGSFLNVVIYRLPIMMEREWKHECELLLDCSTEPQEPIEQQASAFNLMIPRSRCPGCNTLISAWQNIPIISYMLLRGKCGHCKTPISIQYPLVEFSTAALSVLVAMHFGVTIQTLAGLLITWCLIALSMIDFKHTLLPDDITLPLLWLGLIASLQHIFVDPASAIIGAAIGYLSLWTVFQLFKLVTGKEGMGYGDFKLLAVFGAWLGWQAIPMIILLSSVVGAVVGISLILALGRDRNLPIPFGPYLATAGWLSLLYGEQIQTWYFSIIS